MPLTNAERCKRRRERLKSLNPQHYERELAEARARNKTRRQQISALAKDDPRKNDYLAKENERQKKFQAKRQAEGRENVPPTRLTRKDVQKLEARRERNRRYKAASRDRRSSQKKTADRKRDAERQRVKRQNKRLEQLQNEAQIEQVPTCTPSRLQNEAQIEQVPTGTTSPAPSPCKLI